MPRLPRAPTLSELLDTPAWRTTPIGPYADQARTPLEGILLNTALSHTGWTQLIERAKTVLADLPTNAPDALRDLTTRLTPNAAIEHTPDAALAFLTAPPWLAQRHAEDQAKERGEAERKRQAEQAEAQQRQQRQQQRQAQQQQRAQSKPNNEQHNAGLSNRSAETTTG